VQTAPPARPRVLLADDHLAFLESVSRLLTPAFDVVALAGDGRQALDLVRRLRPDVVVLDVSMPELGGFQTLEQLRRDGPEPRVVFLTMHGEDEFVSAAINAGADGYVLKSRTGLDLISAIEHALAGRLFVPSLTSLSTVARSRHTVQFHSSDSHALDEISQLVAATLRSGEQVVIITSEETRTGVAQRLHGRQIDLAMLTEQGQYVAQDSALALSHMMPDGRLDKERVAEMAHRLDLWRRAPRNRPPGRLTIVGDMGAALCRNGDFEAAMELEQVWNDLTCSLPFFTVCRYPLDCFGNPEALNLLTNVCAAHTAVTSGGSRGPRAPGTEVAK
jgi:DNA-binding NarL/FixJ family response regulator